MIAKDGDQETGGLMNDLQDELKGIIDKKRDKIFKKLNAIEIQEENHYEMYQLLGMSHIDARSMEMQHRKQRIISANLGNLVESLIGKCMEKIDGCITQYPIQGYAIDFVYDQKAVEVKLRETTTDGDHFKKEKQKVNLCESEGLVPIRLVMYESPKKIMNKYKSIYKEDNLYVGKRAWDFVREETGFDLRNYIDQLLNQNEPYIL